MIDKPQNAALLDVFFDFVGKVTNITTISLEGLEDAFDKGDTHAEKIDKLIAQVDEQTNPQLTLSVLKEASTFMAEVNSQMRTWKAVNDALVVELSKITEVLGEEIKKNKEQG